MNVGIVGAGEQAAAREQVLQSEPGVTYAGTFGREVLDDLLAGLDVLFVAVPTAEHYAVAEAATKQGVHVFLSWPPATSVRECEAMVRLAEEAGVEVGVSRPLRFHGALSVLPASWRAELIGLQFDRTEAGPGLNRCLADAVDLCCTLAGSSNVQRIDAEAVRSGRAWPEALACGLRFHNGTYAQVVLRQGARTAREQLYAAGAGVELEADLAGGAAYVRQCREGGVDGAFEPVPLPPASLLAVETRAFLQAVAARRTVPVSVLDGLHTMRLVERIMGKLR